MSVSCCGQLGASTFWCSVLLRTGKQQHRREVQSTNIALSLHLSGPFPLCTNNQYINTLRVYHKKQLYSSTMLYCYMFRPITMAIFRLLRGDGYFYIQSRSIVNFECKITYSHAEAWRLPWWLVETCRNLTSLKNIVVFVDIHQSIYILSVLSYMVWNILYQFLIRQSL
jgi:hypothetical protein